jgi:glycosyltransferase involved in cell wall biosynthesis
MSSRNLTENPVSSTVGSAEPDGRIERAEIRVASVPGNHVYVRHLSDPAGTGGVVRLPDPEPRSGERVPWGWWPPAMLEPDWVHENADAFDVFHVHFGFDQRTPAEMEQLTGLLRELDKPVVYTVHDLRNPHHDDPVPHEQVLDVLVPAASAVITLTPGAAAEIHRRWNRPAFVFRHPHVVELTQLDERPLRSDEFVIGIHLKSLRANMDPLSIVFAAADAVGELPDARLRVDLHDEVEDPENYWYNPEVARQLRTLAADGAIDLRVHAYFTDAELWEYMSGLDACVLPYRFGTHSGWLEACYDLGTTVIAPTCGFYAEQHPVIPFIHDGQNLDSHSLAGAVRRAHAQLRAPQATRDERIRERVAIAARHWELYQRLLGR